MSWSRELLALLALCACAVVARDINRQPDDVSDEQLKRLVRVRRVIGGSDVEKGDWPFLAHLRGKVSYGWWRSKVYNCGATVLDKRHLVTAAHCFDGENARTPKYWHATLGESDKDHDVLDRVAGWIGRLFGNDEAKVWYVHADKITIHDGYRAGQENLWKNDLALVRLEKDIPVDSHPHIAALALPPASSPSWPAAGERCLTQGWGCTEKGGATSSIAQVTALKVSQPADCSGHYGGTATGARVCAAADGRGICPGDSGGPLVCERSPGIWTLAGVASFTSSRDPSTAPSAFSNVANYLDWIRNNMQ